MLKWVLIFVLIGLIMLIAISFSEQYKDKYDFYYNLKSFLTQFKINVTFKQEKIVDFLLKIKCKKQFNLFIKDYLNYIKTNKLDLSDLKILDVDEINELEEIIKNTGSLNGENEIKQLNSYLVNVEDKLNKAAENKAKLCPMIIKLSFLFSVALAIILI